MLVALAAAALIMTVTACAGAAWSLWRLRGTVAGAILSAACGALSVCGLALAIAVIIAAA